MLVHNEIADIVINLDTNIGCERFCAVLGNMTTVGLIFGVQLGLGSKYDINTPVLQIALNCLEGT